MLKNIKKLRKLKYTLWIVPVFYTMLSNRQGTRLVLFFSVLLSCLLLVSWHYAFDFITGTPLNIRAFVFNMLFKQRMNIDYFWGSSGVTDLAYSPNGHLYSGYPPGTAFVTLPFFAVEQLIAKLHVMLLGPMNGTLAWWLESIFIALPSMLALGGSTVMLYDLLKRFKVGDKLSFLFAWALPFCTFVLPYATAIHYQPLAMFWLTLALWSLFKNPLTTPSKQSLALFNLLLCGLALGMAALTEYVTVLYAFPLIGYLIYLSFEKLEKSFLWRCFNFLSRIIKNFGKKAKLFSLLSRGFVKFKYVTIKLAPFAFGMLIPLTILFAYNWYAFGAPWRFSHHYMGTMPAQLEDFYTGDGLPHPEVTKRLVPKTLVFWAKPWVSFAGLFFSPLRGLIFHAPLVLIAPVGIYWLWKKRRAEATALVGCLVITTLLYSFWREWWSGWNYGPRFLISQLPVWLLFSGIGACNLFKSAKKLGKKWMRSAITFGLGILFTISFIFTTSAALTGLRDVVREGEAAAPWRLVPAERVSKVVQAFSNRSLDKLSPFIFQFRSDIPVVTDAQPLPLLVILLILLLTFQLIPPVISLFFI